MPGPKPATVNVPYRLKVILQKLKRASKTPKDLDLRVRIILLARHYTNSYIARYLGISVTTVRKWRRRWFDAAATIASTIRDGWTKRQLKALVTAILADAPRSGAPCKFTADQYAQIIWLACQPPELSSRPITNWTPRELADEVVKRGIAPAISESTVRRILFDNDLKPHLSKVWLNHDPGDKAKFDLESSVVTDIYRQANDLAAQGAHILSTDEKPGIQALEPLFPTLPMKPGLVERREA